MKSRFNPYSSFIEDLKNLLINLGSLKLGENERNKLRIAALLKIRLLRGVFLGFGGSNNKAERFQAKEAEKAIARVISFSDYKLKLVAFRIILEAERRGIILLKSTILKLRKAEEEIIICKKSAP